MKTPHRPGIGEKLFFLISGAIISAPFTLLFNTLASFQLMINFPFLTANFLLVTLVAPILEEFAKAYPLFYRHGETAKSLLTLAFYVGLGFGIAEFFLYVFINQVPFDVRLPAVVFHVATVMIVAKGIAQNKAGRYFLGAVALHFAYNYVVFLNNAFSLVGVFLVILISVFLAWMYYKTADEKPIDHWVS